VRLKKTKYREELLEIHNKLGPRVVRLAARQVDGRNRFAVVAYALYGEGPLDVHTLWLLYSKHVLFKYDYAYEVCPIPLVPIALGCYYVPEDGMTFDRILSLTTEDCNGRYISDIYVDHAKQVLSITDVESDIESPIQLIKYQPDSKRKLIVMAYTLGKFSEEEYFKTAESLGINWFGARWWFRDIARSCPSKCYMLREKYAKDVERTMKLVADVERVLRGETPPYRETKKRGVYAVLEKLIGAL